MHGWIESSPRHYAPRKRTRGGMFRLCSLGLLLHPTLHGPPVSAFLQQRSCQSSLLPIALHPRNSRLQVAAATTSSSIYALEKQLESMTVKELRDLLKVSTLNQRGVLSRLKLKKDLVLFLKENLDPSSLDASPTDLLEGASSGEGTTSKEAVHEPSSRSKHGPLSMPKKNAGANGSSSSQTAKEASFERVYQQYPPLRDNDCSGLGEEDIRQKYHPIFDGESTQLTGDMDVIFVGTASCTPGVSRGVSCTALRLNWNRQAIHGVPGGTNSSVGGSFNGGTWLFDCGECTQVRGLQQETQHTGDKLQMRKI